jgi:hypothetical protein
MPVQEVVSGMGRQLEDKLPSGASLVFYQGLKVGDKLWWAGPNVKAEQRWQGFGQFACVSRPKKLDPCTVVQELTEDGETGKFYLKCHSGWVGTFWMVVTNPKQRLFLEQAEALIWVEKRLGRKLVSTDVPPGILVGGQRLPQG